MVKLRPGTFVEFIKFIDFSGKYVEPLSVIKFHDKLKINVSNLNSGIYILQISNDQQIDKVKVLIGK